MKKGYEHGQARIDLLFVVKNAFGLGVRLFVAAVGMGS
jgi:hypothetical protein